MASIVDPDPDGNQSQRDADYRPGAPCMECGDYPGPKHEGSDCLRAIARRPVDALTLLLRVRDLAEELEFAGSDASLAHAERIRWIICGGR